MAEDKLGILTNSIDGLTSEVRTNTYRLDKFENRMDVFDRKLDALGSGIEHLTAAVQNLATAVDTMSKQFASVTSKVIEHDKALTGHETRISVLEAEAH